MKKYILLIIAGLLLITNFSHASITRIEKSNKSYRASKEANRQSSNEFRNKKREEARKQRELRKKDERNRKLAEEKDREEIDRAIERAEKRGGHGFVVGHNGRVIEY